MDCFIRKARCLLAMTEKASVFSVVKAEIASSPNFDVFLAMTRLPGIKQKPLVRFIWRGVGPVRRSLGVGGG